MPYLELNIFISILTFVTSYTSYWYCSGRNRFLASRDMWNIDAFLHLIKDTPPWKYIPSLSNKMNITGDKQPLFGHSILQSN